MNLSEIKSLLRSIRWKQMRLEADMQYLQLLEAAAESAAGMDYSKTRINGGAERQPLADAAVKIVELKEKIKAETDAWASALREVMEIIDAVEDQRLSVLLIKRYRDFKTWHQIAEEMSYSWKQIHRLHARALTEAAKIYNNKKASAG